MNIIEKVHSILSEFPRISEISASIAYELAEEVPDSYALSSTGDILVGEDVTGNQLRRHSFLFYAVWQSQSDWERLNNSGVLLDLSLYLEKNLKEEDITSQIDDIEYQGKINKAACANGMLYAIPDSINDGVRYQMQIVVDYILFTGE